MLRRLPDEPFETGRWFTPCVDRYSQISVRTNKYSVPVRFIDRRVRVLLHASELVVYDGRTEIARHERLLAKVGTRLELDHYLEGLLRKPGALPGATALEQARAAGKFTPIHDAWRAAARKTHGDQHGTRALVEVLLLHRHLPHDQLVAGLAAALKAGALTADAVALEARKVGESQPATPAPVDLDLPIDPIPSLTARRLAHLPPDTRPLPSVAPYATAPPQPHPGRHLMTATPSPGRRRGITEQAADAAVDQACRLLRLPSIRTQFGAIAGTATREQMPYRAFLAELLMTECDDRARRRSERRIRAAGFPRDKLLRAFDFDANPNIDPAAIHTLATCDWIRKSLPLCLIGDSGTGKSRSGIFYRVSIAGPRRGISVVPR